MIRTMIINILIIIMINNNNNNNVNPRNLLIALSGRDGPSFTSEYSRVSNKKNNIIMRTIK